MSFLDWQATLTAEMPFIGGMNLRSSRQLGQKYRSGNMVARGNVIDGDLL